MAQLKRRVRITHPFHPLFTRQFDLIGYRRSWGGRERVDCLDEQGQLVSIPLAWTDAAEPDPFVVLSGGRAQFRVEDLLRLAELMRGLSEAPASEAQGVCKENYAADV